MDIHNIFFFDRYKKLMNFQPNTYMSDTHVEDFETGDIQYTNEVLPLLLGV